jgi:hypothetical protein
LNDNSDEATGWVAMFAGDLATSAAALLEHCRPHSRVEVRRGDQDRQAAIEREMGSDEE